MLFLSRLKVVLGTVAVWAASWSSPAEDLRAPSVPLVACDPYFSIWSPADKLTDADTVHWTGRQQALTSLVRIDGKTLRLLGTQPASVTAMPQLTTKIYPTRTVCTFGGEGVRLTVTFTTPALPQDLMIYSRPVTYLTWEATSTDGNKHNIQVYLDASSRIAVNEPSQPVVWSRPGMAGLNVLRVGSQEQSVLRRAGDNVRIDWGCFYLATEKKQASTTVIGDATVCRTAFLNGGALTGTPDTAQAGAPAESAPVLACAITLPEVTSAKTSSAMVLLAYDDEYSIQYFGQKLRPYWRRTGANATDLLKLSFNDYERLRVACEKFDTSLLSDATAAGGEDYAQICALAYRQCVAACKLVADPNGQPLLFPKENFSNGCIGTVDILYPMAPQFLLLSPSLTRAMLEPVLDYASSSRWKFPFAPHDLGTYPHADGQVYGGGEHSDKNQMPVEESGDLLILVAALSQAEGNADYAAHFWPALEKWAEYLKAKGFDPENQLCTDDFAGHLAHNVNLSAKAIIALGAFGNLCELRGNSAKAKDYHQLAASLADRWTREATDHDHTLLAFDRPGTWSQKYNLVWDRLLGLNLFSADVLQHEVAFYKAHQHAYGLPLDSREDYTKLDWTIWTASLTQNRADFESFTTPILHFLNQTPNRVPMSDWFMTADARQKGFQARSVVGGVFLPLLYEKPVWQKWTSVDTAHTSDWAPLPEMITLVPAADQHAATWKFTTTAPAFNWSATGFDDSNWATGPSGFGHNASRSVSVGTDWNTSDIWLRREVELPEKIDGHPALWLFHDDDAEVYVNGTLVLKSTGWLDGYTLFAPESASAFKPGKNLLAVHCHQNFGGQFIDLGIVCIKTSPAPMPASAQRTQASLR